GRGGCGHVWPRHPTLEFCVRDCAYTFVQYIGEPCDGAYAEEDLHGGKHESPRIKIFCRDTFLWRYPGFLFGRKSRIFFTFFSIDNWHCRVILVRYVIKQLESE